MTKRVRVIEEEVVFPFCEEFFHNGDLVVRLLGPYLTDLKDRGALARCDRRLYELFKTQDKDIKFMTTRAALLKTFKEYVSEAPFACIVYKSNTFHGRHIVLARIINEGLFWDVLEKIPKRLRVDPLSLYSLALQALEANDMELAYLLFTNAFGWLEERLFRAYAGQPGFYAPFFHLLYKKDPRALLPFLAVLGERRKKRLLEGTELDREVREFILDHLH